MSIKEKIFYLRHPKAAIEAKVRQTQVAIEIAGPPANSTVEEFPLLPVSKAAALLTEARQKDSRKRDRLTGGVQLEDWSESDQKLLREGKLPKGVPLHRNI